MPRCTLSPAGKIILKKAESSQQTSSVKKIHTLNGPLTFTDGKSSQFDVAIFELESPFTLNANVRVASLPTSDIPAATNLTVSGWGTTAESNLVETIK